MDREPFIGYETCSMGISQPAEAITKHTIIEIWAEQSRQGELYLADRGNYAQTKLKLFRTLWCIGEPYKTL